MKRPAVTWLIVLLGLIAATAGPAALLWFQEQPTLAGVVGIAGTLVVAAWAIWGLWRFREVAWVARATRLIVGTLIVAVLVQVLLAVGLEGGAIVVGGVWAMVVTFAAGMLLARWLLSPGWPVFGVARTLLDEATRMRLAVVFIVALLIGVPLLPMVVAGESRLQYQVQFFLTWSMILVGILVSLLTVLLVVRSVTAELDERQIFLTLTKPVSRGQYLLGKWLGVMVLNVVLLTVAGLAVYSFAKYLQTRPGVDGIDEASVSSQVLVAREARAPAAGPEVDLQQRVEQRVRSLREEQPERYGHPDDPISTLSNDQLEQVRRLVLTDWYTLAPDNPQTYRFEGLGDARAESLAGREQALSLLRGVGLGDVMSIQVAQLIAGGEGQRVLELDERIDAELLSEVQLQLERGRLQLRFEPDASSGTQGGYVTLQAEAGGVAMGNTVLSNDRGEQVRLMRVSNEDFHVQSLSGGLVGSDGVLELTLINRTQGDVAGARPTVSFNAEDGLQVLYRTGGFGLNLARALGVLWLRLAFLAALALAASSFLSFPVAVLVTVVVYIVAASSGYLLESITSFASLGPAVADAGLMGQLRAVPARLATHWESGDWWGIVRVLIRMIAQVFVELMPSFDRFDTTSLLAEGRRVPLAMLGDAAWRVAGVWTLIVGAIAYWLFQRRELARVVV
jgi:hypothetical protein